MTCNPAYLAHQLTAVAAKISALLTTLSRSALEFSRAESSLSTKTDRDALSDFTFWSWENFAPTDLRGSIQMPGGELSSVRKACKVKCATVDNVVSFRILAQEKKLRTR
jgi:hypothetical protein